MGGVVERRMFSKGGTGMRGKLRAQGVVLRRTERSRTSRRGAGCAVHARTLFGLQPLDRAHTHAERRHDVLTRHAARQGSENTLPEINRVAVVATWNIRSKNADG